MQACILKQACHRLVTSCGTKSLMWAKLWRQTGVQSSFFLRMQCFFCLHSPHSSAVPAHLIIHKPLQTQCHPDWFWSWKGEASFSGGKAEGSTATLLSRLSWAAAERSNTAQEVKQTKAQLHQLAWEAQLEGLVHKKKGYGLQCTLAHLATTPSIMKRHKHTN